MYIHLENEFAFPCLFNPIKSKDNSLPLLLIFLVGFIILEKKVYILVTSLQCVFNAFVDTLIKFPEFSRIIKYLFRF